MSNNNLTQLKQKLTLEELTVFQSDLLNRRKNREAAWGLWAGLSIFGAHRFFTEDYKYASIMLSTTLLPIIGLIIMLFSAYSSFLMYFFSFLLAGSVIWSWIDAFFLNRRIDTLNEKLEYEVLKNILDNR